MGNDNNNGSLPFYYLADGPHDYSEHGCERGAKITDAGNQIDDRDLAAIFEALQGLNLADSLSWIDLHMGSFRPSTVVLDDKSCQDLAQFRHRKPMVFIFKQYLNQVRHLDSLLNRANEELQPGGYVWCHCRTSALKKAVILGHYPKGINWCVYAFHYAWHRMAPKMRPTRWLYFALTKGRNRTYSRVEVLGRLYRAGFEVVDEQFRSGEFFVLARKIKAPIWNDTPSSSPLIKLYRVGEGGQLIGVWKFRTMYSYSEYLQPYIYKYNHLQEGGKFADDYRVNIWGRIMRRTWLDELPMLANVLKGDMKLVGVRPLSPHYFSLYSPQMQDLRISVKPGMLPPFYYDKKTPKTLQDVQDSEKRYIDQYHKNWFRTDWKYLWGTVWNIVARGKRSK